MFDLPPASGDPIEKPPKPPSIVETLGIGTLNEVELIQLRAEIDKMLPTKALVDLNLERELVLQLITVQNLQHTTLSDENVPANQQAQTANTVAAALATLSKLQAEVYTSERVKRLEQILIESLNTLPKEAQETFLDLYEERLKVAGL